jgi:hypothetical protein
VVTAPIATAPAATPLTARPPELPASFADGRYEVKRFLGEGGKKKVYLVHDTLLDRDVAFSLIKTQGLDEVGVERIRREARVMGRLGGHPHIVSVYDMGEEDGQPYLISELMGGGDLEGLIEHAPEHRVPLADTLRIADEVCQALCYAHEHGIIHRDLKPGNVWLTRERAAKLGDFGLAMAIDKTRLSVAGMIVGTVGYMPPEQALGRTPDARGDLYSLGAMLYELTTGHPPFLGDDPVAIISQHINAAPVAPSWSNPDVPPPLEALILRLLAKDPAERPDSAAAVRQELAAVTIPMRATQELEPSQAHDASPLDRVAGGVFVGREHELGQLRNAFDSALSGRAGIVLLAGEPGIGKTALAEETVTYAHLRGAQVLWGRCYEWEGAPAYWPWVQIIRGYVHERDPQQLRSDLGQGAADIAQIVSEVREQLPGLPASPQMEGEQARFRLFDSIATFLRNATTHKPLLLVLDDLHWADTPTLLLLQFVARELQRARLLIVGTYRDVEVGRRHPLTATLAELSRGHRMQRVALHGLTTAEIARFIALSTGIEPEPALVDAVQRETEGNPFFVSEVVHLLVAEGRLGKGLGPTSWSVSIPESVREAVGRRLDQLSTACNDILAVASVVGRDFTLPVLERVSDLSPEAMLDALEEAIRARLIHEEAIAERYRFTHALVQETLYAELSAGQRLRLHAKVGQALEEVHAADLAPYCGELAHHFAIAAPAGHASAAAEYAIKAGQRAMAQLAWETALQHYERALHAIDLQPAPDAAQRCDVLLALGSAQYHAVLDVSESPEGRHSFLRAAEIARSIGSPERLAHAALQFAGLNVVRTAGGVQQVHLLEEALALVPKEDSALRARLLARLAVDSRVIPGASDRIAQLSDEALAMARRLGDSEVLAFVLIARRVAIWGPDNLDERLALMSEAQRIVNAASEPYLAMWRQIFSAIDLYEAGDNQGLDREIDAFVEAAKQSRAPYFLWASEINQTGRAIKEGRFAVVEASVLTLGGDSQALVAIYFRTLLSFLLRREQGRLDELEEPLRRLIDLTRDAANPFDRHRGHVAQAMHMILLAASHRPDEARSRFEAFACQDFADLPKDSYWLTTMVLLADVGAMLEDRQRAARLYDLLLPYAAHNAAPGSGPLFFGSVSYFLGRLATLLARWADATKHYDEALAMNSRMRARPAVAHTQYAYADMLLRRDETGDRERALSLIGEALGLAEVLGMSRLAERALALKVQAQGILKA